MQIDKNEIDVIAFFKFGVSFNLAANVQGLANCGYSLIRQPGTVVDFLFKVQDKNF